MLALLGVWWRTDQKARTRSSSMAAVQLISRVDHVDTAIHQHDDTLSLKGATLKLVVFQSRERLRQISNAPEPRYTRRLSDLIATSFFEACRIGNLDAARQLMKALECEVARSVRVAGVEERYDGDDLATVQVRYVQEVKKRALEHAGSGLPARD